MAYVLDCLALFYFTTCSYICQPHYLSFLFFSLNYSNLILTFLYYVVESYFLIFFS